MPAHGVRVSHLATGMLRNIWHYLHATWYYALRSSVSACVVRCSGPTETVCELLYQGTTDIVRSDVNSVSDTEDHKRALGGEWEARF